MSQSNNDRSLSTVNPEDLHESPAMLPDERIPAPEVMEDVLDYEHENNDPYWYRKIPMSEFLDLESMFEDPWAELMADLEKKRNALKIRTAANDSSVEIICERNPLEDSSSASTSDGAAMNISSSYEVKEGSSVDLPLESMNFDQSKDSISILSSNIISQDDESLSEKDNKSQDASEGMKDVLDHKHEVEESFKEFYLKNDIYLCDTRDSTEISDIKLLTDETKDICNNLMEPGDFSGLSAGTVFVNNDFHGRDLMRDSTESINQQLIPTDEISDFLSIFSEPEELSQLSTDSVFVNNDFYRRELMRDLTWISNQRLSTDEISDFLSHISESSDLSHLSTDSVFIRVSDASRQIYTGDEKVPTVVMKYFGFIERIANATINMFYNLKNYLRLK